jgi:hypothetical protein
MQPIRLLLFVAVVPACFDNDATTFVPPSSSSPPGCSPLDCPMPGCPTQDCHPPSSPFQFFSSGAGVGVGLALDILYQADGALGDYQVTSSDPLIVELTLEHDQLHINALAAGTASITARRRGDPQVLARFAVTAIDIDHAELYFRTTPVSPSPVASLAAVVGNDTLGLGFRRATGGLLEGHATYSVRGTGLAIADNAESRLSDLVDALDRVHLQFTTPGSGELVVSLGGTREQAFPIDVVAAPATLDTVAMVLRGGLVVAPDPVNVGELVGVDIVGRTADGRFVAGVLADWTTTADVLVGTGPSSELVFSAKTAGSINVTATVGTRTLSRTLHAQ